MYRIIHKIIDKIKTKKLGKPLIFSFIGGILGYLYYFYIGCNSGSCPITNNPYGSIVTGVLLGFLISK